ncbi:MAG: OmpA family protein [Bacteriovoracaceae bacterium]|nr:OmpA family protein [Bacteriovoracaceae bacterium]
MSDSDEQGGKVKCPPCAKGAPLWMVTFSDLVTLLLTFFVLLLSFAKTETKKYEAALGSVRKAFGGAKLEYGKVIELGKSPDDSPTMMESEDPIRPFPIEFLTMEGILNKHEINRESDEELVTMRSDLEEFALTEEVDVYEMPEGIKVIVKDKILFKKGTVEMVDGGISVAVFKRIIKMLSRKKWKVFVEGHSSSGETSVDKTKDAFILSSLRAASVTRSLIRRGVSTNKITTVFYGDTRPSEDTRVNKQMKESLNRRVEFVLRKRDLQTQGHKVEHR